MEAQDSAHVAAIDTPQERVDENAFQRHVAIRDRLPDERHGVTHKFQVAGHEGYLRVGCYPDGRPGEIFIKMSKMGSHMSGLVDGFATAISIGLQHGIPLHVYADKFIGTRFDPMGFTGNPEIQEASSVLDYIFRYLMLRFGGDHEHTIRD